MGKHVEKYCIIFSYRRPNTSLQTLFYHVAFYIVVLAAKNDELRSAPVSKLSTTQLFRGGISSSTSKPANDFPIALTNPKIQYWAPTKLVKDGQG
jgi:hypothetical protein